MEKVIIDPLTFTCLLKLLKTGAPAGMRVGYLDDDDDDNR